MRITNYAILGILVGVGAAVLQTCKTSSSSGVKDTAEASQEDDGTSYQYQDLIAKGYITVTKVPHGWRPGR